MSYSYSEATGDGVTKVFPFSLVGSGNGYISTDDLHVFVEGVEVYGFTLSGSNQVQLLTAPPAPVDGNPNIMIRRIVPKDKPYGSYTRGNNFSQEQLNNTALQQLYALHEFLDGFLPEGYFVKGNMNMNGYSFLNTGPLDMGGKAITGLPLPYNPNDAVIKEVTDDLDSRLRAITVGMGTVSRRSIPWVTKTIGGETTLSPPYTFQSALLFLDGVLQNPIGVPASYSVSGNKILMSEPLDSGLNVLVLVGDILDSVVIPSSSTYWSCVTTGGEVEIAPPYEFDNGLFFLDGIMQTPGVSYSISGNKFLIPEALDAGVYVLVVLGVFPLSQKPYETFLPCNASNTPVNSAFLDEADGVLKFKDSSSFIHELY